MYWPCRIPSVYLKKKTDIDNLKITEIITEYLIKKNQSHKNGKRVDKLMTIRNINDGQQNRF